MSCSLPDWKPAASEPSAGDSSYARYMPRGIGHLSSLASTDRSSPARWMAILCIALGCASSPPPGYVKTEAAAQRAYVHGRYEEAARRWLEAAQLAELERDRHEATYRAAASLARAGKTDQAQSLYRKVARDRGGERAARAAFELANLKLTQGKTVEGHRLLVQAIRTHPNSGLASRALQKLVDWWKTEGSWASVTAHLDELIATLDGTELAERLHYAYAGALVNQGRLRAARDRYLYLARRFPYPRGALWDDSLWHASELEERLGDYTAAVAHLERMLAEREPTGSPGSYERPRYDDAQFRIGVLFRDRIHDPERAIAAFLKLYRLHPNSVLRDDALWAAALVARSSGQRGQGCEILRTLVDDLPESRFAPCAKTACPDLQTSTHGRCHGYIRRQVVASDR